MFKSAYEKVGGIFWIARMLEKIRMNAQNQIAEEYRPYLGKGFDGRCVRFLGVNYEDLVKRTLEGGSDDEVLEWMFSVGRKPSDEEIIIWNDFSSKCGWRNTDGSPSDFMEYKEKYGLGHRDDILTYFDFYDVDEGRKP